MAAGARLPCVRATMLSHVPSLQQVTASKRSVQGFQMVTIFCLHTV